MRHFIAREKTLFNHIDRNGRPSESMRESVGWCVLSATGPIFFLKETKIGEFTLKVGLGDILLPDIGFPDQLHILRHSMLYTQKSSEWLKNNTEQFVRLEESVDPLTKY
jgi:hypothetical protein